MATDQAVRRSTEIGADLRKIYVGVNAYPREEGEMDWSFQLAFSAGGTAVTFSGIGRDEMETLRDRINAVLAAASRQPEEGTDG